MELQVQVVDHPLVRHSMAQLRNRHTPPELFRTLTRRVTTLLVIEATRSLRTRRQPVETPLETVQAQLLDEHLVVVPILRAGLGMLDAVVELFPDISVSIGYLGLERDEETAEASIYYSKLPPIEGKTVLLVDPMLATGGSVCHALSGIFPQHPQRVILACIVTAPEGVATVNQRFPQAEIFCAALDRELNSRNYILPGLGDFGDRLYGTI